MPAKIIFTDEMIENLGQLSNNEFEDKYNVSVPIIIKKRKELDIENPVGPNGLIRHKDINGVEHKRCGHCTNWFPATKEYFYGCVSKPDGFMNNCKPCQDEKTQISNSKPSERWTNEMLYDLTQMGDVEFSIKYNIARQLIIKERKVRGIKSFNNQHGIIDHKIIDGIEFKWCSFGHYEPITNFYISKVDYDGLRYNCKKHEQIKRKESYIKWGDKYQRNWAEKNPEKLKLLRYKADQKKKDAYIFWSLEDEQFMGTIFQDQCPWCGSTQNLEREHFIPISSGGKTLPGNIYPCCIECNRGIDGKHTQSALEWATERFGEKLGREKCDYIVDKLQLCQEYFARRINPVS